MYYIIGLIIIFWFKIELKTYGGIAMAKSSPKNKKQKKRVRHHQSMGSTPVILAAVGILVAVIAYFAQSSGLFIRTAGQAETDGIRISEIMASNASTLILEDGNIPDWIEI